MRRVLHFGAFILLILSLSCEKREIWLETTEEAIISALKSNFEAKRIAFENTPDQPDYNFRQELRRTIHWDRSHQSEDGRYFVPLTLTLEGEHARFSNGTHTYPYQTVLMIDPRDQQPQYTLLTFFPDDPAASTFTGVLLFEDYFLGNTQMAHFEDGVSIRFRDDDPHTSELSMSVNAGGGTHCFWLHTGTVCVLDLDHGGAPEICNHQYDFVCIGIPPDIPHETYDPWEGGSGGGGSGGGNSGEGDNSSPTEQAVFEFINQIEDPCLSSVVNRVLNNSNSMRGVIADIIEDLDSRSDVQINIIDGDTSDGSPGQAVNPWIIWEPDSLSKLYTATIVLDNNYMIETSQEGAIAVLIHEILHTYIAESNLLDRRLDLIDNNLHHQIFADKYITPMTTFLQQQFVSLPTLDAYALAWSGLGNLSSHEVVTIEGVSYSRSELGSISAMYYGKFNGQHLAGTDKCIN